MTVRQLRILPLVGLVAWLLLPATAAAQEAEDIIDKLAPKGGQIFRTWRGIHVEGGDPVDPAINTIDVQVNFEFASAQLTPDAKIILEQLGKALADERLLAYRFEIAGHTDAVGSDSFNWALSEARAAAVRDYLVEKLGIDSNRLLATGYGESRLVLPGDPENGANRRVQITNLGQPETN